MRLPEFWLLAVCNVGGVVASALPFLYIPPLAKEKGLSTDDTAFFVSMSAVTDFVGRLGSGIILHFKVITPSALSCLVVAMMALIFNLTGALNEFYTIMSLTLIFGLCSSTYFAIQSLLTIEVLGLTQLGDTMGWLALMNGAFLSVSYYFSGWLHDTTGTYTSVFHYFGILSLLATLSLVFIMLPRYRSCCALKCMSKSNKGLQK